MAQQLTGDGWIVTPLGLQIFENPPFVTSLPVYSYACDVYFAVTGATERIQSWVKGYTQEENIADALNYARTTAPTLSQSKGRKCRTHRNPCGLSN